MELIHANGRMEETGVIDCFTRFDAQIGLYCADVSNDFELTLDEGVWKHSPIECGDYIYIPGTEWGGQVESVCHESAYGRVKVSGACWRGLLSRIAVVPPDGATHLVLSSVEGNETLRRLMTYAPAHFAVSEENSGILCSGSVRYRPLTQAAESLLSDASGRLGLCFSDGTLTVSALPSSDLSGRVEFSQEYDAAIVSTKNAKKYDRIIALGRGTMLDRQVTELWLGDDGTVTDTPPQDASSARTYIYDYSSVESEDILRQAAEEKLRRFASGTEMEISVGDTSVQLEPGDRAGVRDLVTGMSRVLTVTAKRLTVSENSVRLTHTLA